MHHVRALKDKAGEPFTVLKKASRQRKTTVLCRRCHVAIHAGRMASRAESRVR
jgi:RNA-directed DNA polymerase